LVELMGGRIDLQSREGRGTQFEFTLSFEVPVDQHHPTIGEVCAWQDLKIQAKKIRSKGRILLVEDYITNQQVAEMHLSSAGYQVDIAEDGRKAIEKAASNAYDLILMDLEMPGMDGLDAVREIRRVERSRNGAAKPMPIIALTTQALKGQKASCREVGMDDFLSKPIRRKPLLDRVHRWISTSVANPIGSTPEQVPAQMEWPDAHQTDLPMDWDVGFDGGVVLNTQSIYNQKE
jgi:hypothetical protein